MAGDQFADPGGESSRCRRPDLQSKASQYAAQAHLDVMVLTLQQLARRQQRPYLLRRQGFAVHRAEPAEPHQLSDAACILAVGLDRHCLERVPDVPGLEQFDRQPRFPHACIQPLRQRSGLQSDPRHSSPRLPNHRSGSRARWPPWPRARSARSRRQHTGSRFPMTRRYRHSAPWSSLDDVWSRPSLTPLANWRPPITVLGAEKASVFGFGSDRLVVAIGVAAGPSRRRIAEVRVRLVRPGR